MIKNRLKKIKDLALGVIRHINKNRKPTLTFPIRALSNVRYHPRKGYFQLGSKNKKRTLTVSTVKTFAPEPVRRVVSTQTAKTIRRILKTVITEGGTGVNAALEGYSVCGKTGTAQKIDESGTYARDRYLASFVGFAPADHPELAILVIVDEPKEQNYGGIVAAPAFRQIALETLSYLNIPPGADADRLRVSRGNRANG